MLFTRPLSCIKIPPKEIAQTSIITKIDNVIFNLLSTLLGFISFSLELFFCFSIFLFLLLFSVFLLFSLLATSFLISFTSFFFSSTLFASQNYNNLVSFIINSNHMSKYFAANLLIMVLSINISK